MPPTKRIKSPTADLPTSSEDSTKVPDLMLFPKGTAFYSKYQSHVMPSADCGGVRKRRPLADSDHFVCGTRKVIVNGTESSSSGVFTINSFESPSVSGTPTEAHDGEVVCLVPSRDGAYLLSSSTDGHIRLWNAGTGSHCFVDMDFRPDLNSQGIQRIPRPFIQRIHAVVQPRERLSRKVKCLWGRQADLSTDGNILFHMKGNSISLYRVFSGVEQRVLFPGHLSEVFCIQWNEILGELYTGAGDGSIFVYDARGQSCADLLVGEALDTRVWCSSLGRKTAR